MIVWHMDSMNLLEKIKAKLSLKLFPSFVVISYKIISFFSNFLTL